MLLPTRPSDRSAPRRAARRRRAALGAGLAIVVAAGIGGVTVPFVGAADAAGLFEDTFDSGLTGWSRSGGRWQVQDGVLEQTRATSTRARLLTGSTSWTDYTVTATVALGTAGSTGTAGVLARAGGSTSFARLVLTGAGTAGLEVVRGSRVTTIGSAPVTAGPHTLTLEVRGSSVRGLVDGTEVAAGDSGTLLRSGRIGLMTTLATATFDTVTVTAPDGPVDPTPSPSPTATPTSSATPSTSATPSATPSAGPSSTPSPSATVTTAAKTFTNPIKAQGPDPWLTYHDGNFYLATTTWNNTVTMRKAASIAELAKAPDQVIFTLTRPNGAGTMWAPEFHLLDGPNGKRWYFYYTAGREPFDLGSQRIHVLESAGLDPMGPYSFKADLLDPQSDNTWELDASILQLDGKLYLLGTFYNGSQPAFIRPLSNPWTASGTRHILTNPTLPWETAGGAVAEGPEVLQRDGKTFIIYSASHCSTPDYKLGMLTYTGGDPLNSSSWVKSNQPVFQRSDANSVYAPGHNGFFTSPDGTETWMVYHAISTTNAGCDMNRSTRVQKISWNADGTPNLGVPVRAGAAQQEPSGVR